MYFKVITSKNFHYLKLVESYRENGKTHQRVIANLGRLDILKQQGQLHQLAKRLLLLDGLDIPTVKDLEELNRYCYGDVVYKKLEFID